jgi:hypothetical protein
LGIKGVWDADGRGGWLNLFCASVNTGDIYALCTTYYLLHDYLLLYEILPLRWLCCVRETSAGQNDPPRTTRLEHVAFGLQYCEATTVRQISVHIYM